MAWTSVNIIAGYTKTITMLFDDPVRKECVYYRTRIHTWRSCASCKTWEQICHQNVSCVFIRALYGFYLYDVVKVCDLCVYDVWMVCVYLTFLSIRLRLLSKLGSHFLAAVSTVFNFTNETCPVFVCNLLNPRTLRVTLQRMIWRSLFLLLFYLKLGKL